MKEITSTDEFVNKPKRGPKPLGSQSMTPAERQRKSRQKKEQGGSAEFTVTLARGKLAFIDQLAKAGNMTRSATLDLLLDTAFSNVAVAVAEASGAMDAGAPDTEVVSKLQAALVTSIAPAIIPKYKEILGIK